MTSRPLEGSRKMIQDKVFVLEVLQGMVRADLATWRTHPSGEGELQLEYEQRYERIRELCAKLLIAKNLAA